MIGAGLFLISQLSFGNSAASPLCVYGPYVIYFRKNATRMEGDAEDIIAHMIDNQKFCPEWEITIDGFADARESRGMDRRRAMVVRDILASRKIPSSLLFARWLGSPKTGLSVQSSIGYQDSRVEVRFGPRL